MKGAHVTLPAPARLLRQLPSLRYLMVGALCLLLNLAIMNVAVLLLDIHYAVACMIAFVILVPLSFFLHKEVTFKTQSPLSLKRFALYTLQWGWLHGLNLALLAVLVDLLHLHVSAAIVLVALITHVFGFLYSRRYVFMADTRAKQ